MNEKIIAKLKELAERSCWTDDDEFMVDDYAGGNMDDAFEGGCRNGEVWLAREILSALGVEYNEPC